MLLTYRYRVKDATAGQRLARMAGSVNQVWNYCGGIQNDSRRLNRRWASGFDLIKLTSGSSKELGLHSDTVQAACKQFAISRDKAKRKPRWRVSRGPKRSLGWVPFQCDRPLKIDGDTVTFLGQKYRLWLSRPIPADIRSGSFSEDAEGRWYLNPFARSRMPFRRGTAKSALTSASVRWPGFPPGRRSRTRVTSAQRRPNWREPSEPGARRWRAGYTGRSLPSGATSCTNSPPASSGKMP